MMSDTLIIAGSGGHAKVVADIASLNGYKEIVYLDDNTDVINKPFEFGRVLGTTKDIDRFNCDVFVAIGDAKVRKELIDYYLIEKRRNLISLIHPSAVIGNGVLIDNIGVVVMPGVVINNGSQIMRGSIINTCSSVDHDCYVGEYCHIAVGAHLCGNVLLNDNSWIGAGATIINNVSLARGVTIGAGAVVIEDVNESGIYVGVPAKRLR